MAGLSSPGIGSGLDINGLVSKLMSVEQQPLTQLDTQEASYQTKITALGTLKGAIASLQSAVGALNDPSKFTAKTVSSADSSVITGSASTIATAGSYSMVISSLAQAQNLSSTGFASNTATIGTGTLTFQFGTSGGVGGGFTLNPDKGTQSVTIDSSQNTLAGISDAINAANIGVSASIINDGSLNGNRLVLTSSDSGAANEMKITSTSSTGDLSVFNFDPTVSSNAMTENAAAANAEVKINGLTVSKASNTITDAIHGVTLNLLKLSDGTPPSTVTTLTVARDDSGTQTAVQSFVKAYNDASKELADVSAYDATTKKAGPLQGDFAVLTIQRQLRSMLSTPLSSPGGGLSTLSDIGVSFQKDGTLALDTATLSEVLADPTKDVSTLFAAVGKASDALVSVAASTTDTKPGSYAINITHLATRGQLLGAATPISLTIASGSNDTLGFTIDGDSDTVTLSAGTYTPTTLAAEVQSRINGSATLISAGSAVSVGYNGTRGTAVGSSAAGLTITAGSNDALDVTVDGTAVSIVLDATVDPTNVYTAASLAAAIQTKINAALPAGTSVAVSQSNGVLTIASDSYGINGAVTSAVNVTGGNARSDLFGTLTPTETAGTGDGLMLITSNRYGSASTVSISGDAATNLTGVGTATAGTDVAGTIGSVSATGSGQYLTGSGDAAGLKLLIDGTTTGDRGAVTFSQGYAFQLDVLTGSFLDTTGIFATKLDSINTSIEDIGTRRTELQQRLIDIEARYRAQFNALDSLIASMQATQSFLTQQLSSLSALANYTVTGGNG